jgi:hypothetical protein
MYALRTMYIMRVLFSKSKIFYDFFRQKERAPKCPFAELIILQPQSLCDA